MRFSAKRETYRTRYFGFHEWKPLRSNYMSIPSVNFGIELEMSCARGTHHQTIADYISQKVNVPTKVAMEDYSEVKKQYHGWKLSRDGSIACSRNAADCSKFELVSPIMNGESGLNQCKKVLQATSEVCELSVNRSMGFHVHVDVNGFGLEHLKNVCLNFIKYEHVFDVFMPPSRRDEANNEYCKSNRDAVPYSSSGEKHNAVASCKSLFELCDLMNPNQVRYFKLNLQNLRKDRQPTLEFRQHSATGSWAKVEAWVRFCVSLVHNSSATSRGRPRSLREGDDACKWLFDTVVQDLRLKEFYHQRIQEFVSDKENKSEACCNNCTGGECCEKSNFLSFSKTGI